MFKTSVKTIESMMHVASGNDICQPRPDHMKSPGSEPNLKNRPHSIAAPSAKSTNPATIRILANGSDGFCMMSLARSFGSGRRTARCVDERDRGIESTVQVRLHARDCAVGDLRERFLLCC